LEKVLHLQQYEKHMYDSVCCNVSDKASVMYVYTDYYIYMFHFVDSRNAIPEKKCNAGSTENCDDMLKLYFVDLLWICCTANTLQQIHKISGRAEGN